MLHDSADPAQSRNTSRETPAAGPPGLAAGGCDAPGGPSRDPAARPTRHTGTQAAPGPPPQPSRRLRPVLGEALRRGTRVHQPPAQLVLVLPAGDLDVVRHPRHLDPPLPASASV